MLHPSKPVVREDGIPYLYLCPICEAPIHFADGFVFCTFCGFARSEDSVTIQREFTALPIPSTKQWNPSPRYYCKKCNGIIVNSGHRHVHPNAMVTYVREYHFGCGGTHATFRIYPFRNYKQKKQRRIKRHKGSTDYAD